MKIEIMRNPNSPIDDMECLVLIEPENNEERFYLQKLHRNSMYYTEGIEIDHLGAMTINVLDDQYYKESPNV